jgi:hypothetical protein
MIFNNAKILYISSKYMFFTIIFNFVNSKPDMGVDMDCGEVVPSGLELLQQLQDDSCTTIAEKERKLSEMILQLQLFREQLQGQLLTQQHHPNKVIDFHAISPGAYIKYKYE